MCISATRAIGQEHPSGKCMGDANCTRKPVIIAVKKSGARDILCAPCFTMSEKEYVGYASLEEVVV